MAAAAATIRQRTPSMATLGRLEPKDANDALWNLNLLEALRSGDPGKIHPYLADLSRLANATRRASTSPNPSPSHSKSTRPIPANGGGSGSGSGNGSTSSLVGKSRISAESDRSGGTSLGPSASPPERAAYILHTAIRVASCQTISSLLSHKQISPNIYYPPSPSPLRTTPLHLAAQLGRADVVRLLLEQEEVDDTLRDGHGRTVAEVAANARVTKILKDSVQELTDAYLRQVEDYIRSAAGSPPPTGLIHLLKSQRSHQLELTVQVLGTTILHEASRRGHIQIIELCLARDADIFARDSRNRAPLDVVLGQGREKDAVRALLRQYTNRDLSLVNEPEAEGGGVVGKPGDFKGYLNKYANVAKGYSTRYFVLQDGTLSYYRNQSDYPTSCRGSIHTSMISVKTSSTDRLRLEITLHPPSTSGLPGTSKPDNTTGTVQHWFLRGEHPGEIARWAQVLRRNVEYYTSQSRDGTAGGRQASKDVGEAGGPFLRKGFTRSLSITGLSRKVSASGGHHDTAAAAPRSSPASGSRSTSSGTVVPTLGAASDVHRAMSGTSLSVSGLPTELLAGSESSDADAEGAEVEGEESKDPPYAEWEMAAEGMGIQLDALRLALPPLGLPPAQVAALLDGLNALGSLAAGWRTQQKAREKWYENELERERQTRNLWEESLAGVVGESERMEQELQVASRRLRSMRNLRASMVGTETGTPAVGPVIAPTLTAEPEKELPQPPQLLEEPLSLSLPSAGLMAPGTTPGRPVSVAARTMTTDEEDEDDEFFDAIDSGLLPLTLPSPIANPTALPEELERHVLLDRVLYAGYEHPRARLPIDDDQRPPVSLWAVLKNSIGKDLTRISFPVFFNEPTSMLQRMAEDMEFSECLDAAVRESDPLKRIAFVAAFAMSNYSSTLGRIAKPFNPMLSETFEYASFDKQYRYFSEQVSHHPPISACYCESPDWLYYGEVDAKNKFMGRSFEIRPTGAAFADLMLSSDKVEHPDKYPVEEVDGEKRYRETYSWKKVTTNVSGFILGNVTIDHSGLLRVVNHRTGDTCELTFKPRGWRGTNLHEIKGAVYDSRGQLEWEIAGRWSSQLVMRHADSSLELGPDVNVHGPGSPASQTAPEYILLWRNTPKPPAPFNLTPYAITLNDLPKNPELLRKWLPITDCRLRPDQRAFEEGRYEEANALKSDQEDFQRATRRARERGELPPHEPRWFTPDIDEDNGERVWRPKRRGSKVEYWAEREEAGLAGRPWKDVEQIFIDV
ncbi:hypothetical protein DACRYDRAFT_24184 [Dacryopinax primogenitus]|uniref:PH domain-containing protein n=1 Tax=Dacryopinax primogenitus (strain DJM 731) TaxID=1858805 RepID=M5G5V8_DACPD|nr:uncharacterized protein DACRYDRAFT_24184 [Dacryopinax primogenitus]EJT99142.1 hypothetical protein DACRYDRAFT_24184 [Dacryopinax primogenitus]